MKGSLKRLWSEESGQGLAEYGLILGLVAIGVIAVLGTMRGHLTDIFTEIGDKLDTATP